MHFLCENQNLLVGSAVKEPPAPHPPHTLWVEGAYKCHCAPVLRSGDNFGVLCHMDPGNRTQVITLGSKRPHLLRSAFLLAPH